jgi:hypothetical protein
MTSFLPVFNQHIPLYAQILGLCLVLEFRQSLLILRVMNHVPEPWEIILIFVKDSVICDDAVDSGHMVCIHDIRGFHSCSGHVQLLYIY